jgi:CRP/FNR family transcriptional regulator, cyclic AMP receptor protein
MPQRTTFDQWAAGVGDRWTLRERNARLVRGNGGGEGSSMKLRNRSQKVDVLAGVPLFAYLTKKQLTEIARHADEIEVEDGRVLIAEGSTGRELFIVIDGTASVQRQGRTIATLTVGDVAGEMSLLDGEPRSATVVADGPMSLLVVSGQEFEPLLRNVPDLAVRMLRSLAQRLRAATEALT